MFATILKGDMIRRGMLVPSTGLGRNVNIWKPSQVESNNLCGKAPERGSQWHSAAKCALLVPILNLFFGTAKEDQPVV